MDDSNCADFLFNTAMAEADAPSLPLKEDQTEPPSEKRKKHRESLRSFCRRTIDALNVERKSEEAVSEAIRATVSGRELQRQGLTLMNLQISSLSSGLGGKLMVLLIIS